MHTAIKSLPRVSTIDFTRGLAMVIMALDHVRDLFHADSLTQDPTNLSQTTALLFFTRFITHFCAPTFVFLSGVSVYLSMQRQGNPAEARAFLFKRGLWLILLEFTVVNFAIWFDIQFRLSMLQVIAAIGFSFILLALVLTLNKRLLLGLALLIVCGHDLLLLMPPAESFPGQLLSSLAFRLGLHDLDGTHSLLINYPVIPWFGIMLLGYSVASFFQAAGWKTSLLLRTGLLLLLGFVVLRFLNIYGDPAPWSAQPRPGFTILSFLNVTKYPPSLIYTLLFLGCCFLVLAWGNVVKGWLARAITTFGQVPMFYYLLHFWFIRLGVFVMVFLQGFQWSDLQFGPFQFGRPATGSGVSIGYVYLIWIALVLLLYPLCHWYAGYRKAHPEKRWLRYL